MAMDACASCGAHASVAPPVSLSRCSRCKWVSYCSKPCQLRHWKHGVHQRQCTALAKAAAFRDAEARFWRMQSTEELAAFTAQEGLEADSMRFYGEVLFVLCGLKPCVMMSNLPSHWREAFIRDVIKASGLLQEPFASNCRLSLFVVAANLQTPAEYPLQGTLVLVNATHPTCASIIQALHLHRVELSEASTPLPPPPTSSQGVVLVEESTLARLLDYPVALDECVDPMIEVGYFTTLADGSMQLLMSYCASADAGHSQRIRAHFQRYQQHFDAATLPLVIRTSVLSD